MKRILIPTDFSGNSWNALEYALSFYKNQPCNFYILHVGDLRESSVNSNSFAFSVKKSPSSIKENLDSLFERIALLQIDQKHQFIPLQEYGNFIDIIRKTVKSKKIDLIAMGTKGASGLKSSVIGSNTGDVITKVICNVLVVPENVVIKTPKEIAFPTDYNLFYTHPVLEAITETLRISKANINILNVSKGNLGLTTPQERNRAYLQDYLGETFPNTSSFHHVVSKNTKRAILNFVIDKNIELLVMVAKNLNFLQQLLFDTTIEKLSFHTKVPLLVLHE